jgi:hypothetical protein
MHEPVLGKLKKQLTPQLNNGQETGRGPRFPQTCLISTTHVSNLVPMFWFLIKSRLYCRCDLRGETLTASTECRVWQAGDTNSIS